MILKMQKILRRNIYIKTFKIANKWKFNKNKSIPIPSKAEFCVFRKTFYIPFRAIFY